MVGKNQVRDSVLQAIGNTPVVRLRKLVTAGMADVLVKLEYYNPTGSYKDRMALAMIEGAEARGELRAGNARGGVDGREHGIVAGDGVRDQGVSVYADFVGRIFG